MANTCTSVNIVGADDHANELLHQVVFLVGTPGRRNTANGIRAVFGFYLLEFGGNEIVGLIPANGLEVAILSYHRLFDTFGMFVEAEGKTALETGMALVYFCVVRGLYTEDLPTFDTYLQIAAYATIGTYGPNLFLTHQRLGLEDIRYGRGWTGLCTGSAADAIRIEKTLVGAFDNLAVKTTSHHAEYKLSLNLVTGPDTAVAHDAFGKVRGHIGMTQVLLPIEVVFAFRITYLSDPDAGRSVLQLTVAIHFAGQAVQGMIREDELNDILA